VCFQAGFSGAVIAGGGGAGVGLAGSGDMEWTVAG